MSEDYFHWSVTVVPVDPEFVPRDDALAQAVAAVAGMSLCAVFATPLAPTLERHAEPRFYGSEGFSYSASCPRCGARVQRDSQVPGTPDRHWFAQVDDLASEGAPGATRLTMPGCGHDAALGDIAFEYPTGAARWAIVCDLPIWLDGWLEDGGEGAADALERLPAIVGAPVRLVRRLFLLHPQLRRGIALLCSGDAARRGEGLATLEAHDEYVDDGAIYDMVIQDNEAGLTAALATDPSPAVRARALVLLVEGKCFNEAVRAALIDGLRRSDETTDRRLMLAMQAPSDLRDALLPLVRALAGDPSRAIRSSCARVLHRFNAHGPEDRAIQRGLAIDAPWSNTYAVLAMQDWIKASGAPPDDVDARTLREVIARCPDTVAASYARKLLA